MNAPLNNDRFHDAAIPAQDRQVRPKPALLTDSDVRRLTSPAINRMCMAQGVERTALNIGCDEKTVRRAREEETTLKAATLFNMLSINPHALDVILAHFGMMTVPLPECASDPMVNVAMLNAALAQASHPDSPGGAQIVHSETRDMAAQIDIVMRHLLAMKGEWLRAEAERLAV